MRCALSETPQGLKNLLKINSYIFHIDRTDLIKLSFLLILTIVVFLEFGNQKKCRGRDNSQNGQGGHGIKSLRTPDLESIIPYFPE